MSDLRLKCTKFDFAWGLAPDHAREAYSAALPQAYCKGEREDGKGKRRGKRGKGRERKGKRGEGRGILPPPFQIPGSDTVRFNIVPNTL